MTISVIITVAGNDIDRYVNLLQLLKCLKNQTRLPDEVVIVEQLLDGDHQYYTQIPHELNNMKYYSIRFLGHDKLFSVSWCRNVGIYKATSDIVICIDVDYMFSAHYLETISELDIKNYYLGWSTLYFINKIEKHRIIHYDVFPIADINTDYRISTKNNFREGGLQIFNKQWFIDNLGGFSEDMFGWGREDVDINFRIKKITGELNMLNYTVYHLWHRKNPAMKDLLNNHLAMEKNCANPILTAQLIREKGVGNPEHPSPIYPDSVKWSEP